VARIELRDGCNFRAGAVLHFLVWLRFNPGVAASVCPPIAALPGEICVRATESRQTFESGEFAQRLLS